MSYLPPTHPLSLVQMQTVTPTIVTSTGSSGTQISATKDVSVNYPITITTTASIGGNASGTVVLEIAATNSTTPGDWTEISRVTNAQSITLAIVLQSVQTISGSLSGVIPAGYYRKIRSINNSGTPTYSTTAGQEVSLI